MLSFLRTTAVVIAATILLGCPNKRKIASPEPPVPRNGDQSALQRFEESQAQFQQGGGEMSAAETATNFEKIAQEFPDDPIVPHALLYAGMSAVGAGEWDKAIENLNELIANQDADDALIVRGFLYRGIAKNYAGDYQGAVVDLKAGQPSVGSTEGEKPEYLAAMALAHVGLKRVGDALPYFDAWYRVAKDSEKVFIVSEVAKAVDLLAASELEPVWGTLEDKKGPSAAYLGRRIAATLRSVGETTRAKEVDRATAFARARFGFELVGGDGGSAGDPERVGGLLPLSGRSNRIGDQSVRGLSLAASFGTEPGKGARLGWPKPFSLRLRDSRGSAEQATRMLGELAAEDVIAIVGPVSRLVSRAAATEATKLAIPMVTLSQRPSATDSPYVFHVFHSAARRAEILARYAYQKGVRDFAVMKPKNGYGRAVASAFAAEVTRLGGQVIVTVSYSPSATSFRDIVKRLKKPWQAIFVADTARRLELIAPSLAVANFVPRPLGAKGRGRSILLLSTAEFLTEALVKSAGIHVYGAVFAPGFYADGRDGRIGEFVDRYLEEFGRAPTAIDAYAFDAALLIRSGVEAGAENRAQLAQLLASESVAGLTGQIRFEPTTHQRADAGLLFAVTRLSSGGYAIRAMRGK